MIALRIPFSNPPACRPLAKNCSGVSRSASVTGRRNALRVRCATICFAHGSSSASLAGRQTKIFLRLGVSLTPVGSIGPSICSRSTLSGLSSPSMMPTSPPPGMNGCSTASDSASVRATNVAATVCGPAVTGTRMRSKRELISATAAAWRVSTFARSSGPPIVFAYTSLPSTATISVCRYSSPST
jgi:hypothetical protein